MTEALEYEQILYLSDISILPKSIIKYSCVLRTLSSIYQGSEYGSAVNSLYVEHARSSECSR